MTEDSGDYAKAKALIDANLWKLKGKRFSTNDMHEACGIERRVEDKRGRDSITRVLYEESNQNPKRKKPHYRSVGFKFYELINRERVELLLPTGPPEPVDFTWPLDVDTGMEFPFADDIIIEPGDIIAMSGESNRGKSTLCINIAVENALRAWAGRVSMWISEWHPTGFQRRLMQYPGALNGDGQPIFGMYKLDLKDIVDQIAEQPDYLHILDWVNMKDNFYQIAGLQEGIVEALAGRGVAVIAGQKTEDKEHGIGGEWGEFNTSVAFTVSRLGDPVHRFNRLKLMKVKSPKGDANLDRVSYRFKTVKLGSRIAEIDEIKDCRRCFGTGMTKKRGGENALCEQCEGQGYTLVYRPIEAPPPVEPADPEPDPEDVRF